MHRENPSKVRSELDGQSQNRVSTAQHCRWFSGRAERREENMGRRVARKHFPLIEECECRAFLSGITDVMAANGIAASMRSLAEAASRGPSIPSVAAPQNQGPLLNPDGSVNNAALAPTGNVTQRQFHKEQFKAHFIGTYTVGAGPTTDERNQVFITGAGSAKTMLHSDIQMLLVTPNDPNSPIGGVATIFDRNINSNSNAGFDIAGEQSSQSIGRNGLPVFLNKVSIDVNISSGLFTEGYSIGSIRVRYIPSGKQTRGVLSQGKAVVTLYARIYVPNASLLLRNTHINP
jgi:hypothetical protein